MKMNDKTVHFKNCLGVFQGGGCKAIAFVGAYEEARSRGVFFSELAGTSAGSIFAALIAAGATPEDLKRIISETEFKKFNAPVDKKIFKKYGSKWGLIKHVIPSSFIITKALHFIKHLGLYSSSELEEWLNTELNKLLGKDAETITFKDLKLPLHVIATDISQQQQMIWNVDTTPNKSVALAVRCSCTIPFYFQPVDMAYVDGGLVSNLPTFSLNSGDTHFEKILCFTLSETITKINGVKDYLRNLSGAVIDGAVQIQELLQNNTYNIKIKDLPITTTDFENLTTELIKETIEIGSKASSDFFDHETINISKRNSQQKHLTKDYILNSVVMENAESYERIVLSMQDTKLIYSLFPTIFGWVHKKTRVTFVTRPINKITSEKKQIKHEKYRRFLLKQFGIQLIEKTDIPFNAFLFKSKDRDADKSILLYEGEELNRKSGHGAIYDSNADVYVHESLWNTLGIDEENNEEYKKFLAITPSYVIKKIPTKEFTSILKKVNKYTAKNINIQQKNIDIDTISSMTKYVKSYKHNQIEKLLDILNDANISLFETCAISFSDGIKLMITPPIIEQHGDQYILIKGSSRISYCYRSSTQRKLKAIIVSNVNSSLPSTGAYSIADIIITTINKEGNTRYDKWDYEAFRNIEETIRNPDMFI